MNLLAPIRHFVNLIYPSVCDTCGELLVGGEEMLCTSCRYDLPKTNYWTEADNPVEQAFWGRVPIESAASYFYFARGSKYRKLLHKLKYGGRRDIGVTLGKWFGSELAKSTRFAGIDAIIPVPLHPKKQHKRGYNQSAQIAEGLSLSMNIPVDTKTLQRAEYTETQTRKDRMQRWQNVSTVFKVADNAQNINGKHFLVVDDVLTTGATIEACCNALLAVGNCKISIVTLAFVK